MTDEVIQLAEWRVTRLADTVGRPFSRKPDECNHQNSTMVADGQFVRCDDCSMQLAPFWVLGRLLYAYRTAMAEINRREETHRARVAQDLTLTAALRVQKAWRSRKMVPTCPHCSRGIFAADGFGNGSACSIDYELARRRAKPPEQFSGIATAEVVLLCQSASTVNEGADE